MPSDAGEIVDATSLAFAAAARLRPRMTVGELIMGIASIVGTTQDVKLVSDAAAAAATALVQLVGEHSAMDLIRRVVAASDKPPAGSKN